MPTVIIPPTDVSPYTGTGDQVLANTPTLITPNIGAATGTSLTVTGNLTAADLILGTSGPSVKSSLGVRAPRQGLVFDGTNGGTIANPPVFGSGDFTFSGWVNLKSLPAVGASIINGGAGSFFAAIDSAGKLWCGVNSGVELSKSTQALSVGKFYFISIVKSSGTTTYYINGVSDSSRSDSNTYSASAHIASDSGNNFIWNGQLIIAAYNRALSASEVVSLYEAGAPAGADYATPAATNTSLNTVAFANTGYGFNAYTTFSGASATGFSAAATTAATYAAGTGSTFNTTNGKNLRVTFTLTLNSGQAPTITIAKAFNPDASANYTATAGSNTFVIPMTRTDTGYTVRFLNTAATDYVISNFSVVPAGLLLAPDIAQAGGGSTWYDTSGNAANITLPASGVTWGVPTSGQIASTLSITNSTASTSSSTGALVVTGGAGIGGALYTGGNATVGGTLTVSGQTATVGVSPYSWNVYRALDLDARGLGLAGAGDAGAILVNAYYNSGWKYKGTSSYKPTDLEFFDGAFTFKNAAAGTADGAITWSTLLTLANTGNATLAGNLTVSGTGTSSVAGKWLVNTTTDFGGSLTVNKSSQSASSSTPTGAVVIGDTGTTGALELGVNNSPGYLAYIQSRDRTGASFYQLNLNPAGGDVLFGTTTNSGNGKLQLATHTTSAGGIGFGTDVALFRPAAGFLQLEGATFAGLKFKDAGAGAANYIVSDNGALYIGVTDTPSAGNDALSIDTSKNATFAGTVSLSTTSDKAGLTLNFPTTITGSNGPAMTFKSWTNSASLIDSGRIASVITDGSASYGSKLELSVASSGTLTTALTFFQDLAASFAGEVRIASGKALKLGNAYVAGAPTATGYVTIQDSSGTTYKVLVST